MRGGKRPNSGRKAPAEGIRINRSIKMTDQEWKQLQDLAAAHGMNASEYVRTKLLQKETDK